jgi:hypothetical protein
VREIIDLKFGYVLINNKGHVKLEIWVLKLREAGHLYHIDTFHTC